MTEYWSDVTTEDAQRVEGGVIPDFPGPICELDWGGLNPPSCFPGPLPVPPWPGPWV